MAQKGASGILNAVTDPGPGFDATAISRPDDRLLQRWLGLATVSIQTAAGSATPEVTLEGVLEAEALRDFLYTKMRGVRDGAHLSAPPHASSETAAAGAGGDEALVLLIEIRDSLTRLEGRLSGAGRPL